MEALGDTLRLKRRATVFALLKNNRQATILSRRTRFDCSSNVYFDKILKIKKLAE
jgi:hypothetical protein